MYRILVITPYCPGRRWIERAWNTRKGTPRAQAQAHPPSTPTPSHAHHCLLPFPHASPAKVSGPQGILEAFHMSTGDGRRAHKTPPPPPSTSPTALSRDRADLAQKSPSLAHNPQHAHSASAPDARFRRAASKRTRHMPPVLRSLLVALLVPRQWPQDPKMSVTRVGEEAVVTPRAPRTPSAVACRQPQPGGFPQNPRYHTTQAPGSTVGGCQKEGVWWVGLFGCPPRPTASTYYVQTLQARSGVFHGRSREIRPRERKGVLCVLFGVVCVQGWDGMEGEAEPEETG